MMDELTLERRLLTAAEDKDDFPYAIDEIVEGLSDKDEDFRLVQVVLKFMERHPMLDYGVPGALVHFVERFYQRGYEQELIESVSRHPVVPTLGMLNRLINGASDPVAKERLIGLMQESARHVSADTETRRLANFYLESY